MADHRRWGIAGLSFLAGALAVLAVELRLVQREADALARLLSREAARPGNPSGGLRDALLRLQRERGLELMALFDPQGGRVAEVRRAHGEEGHGVVFAVRAGVRDLTTGRELLHLVVHRDIRHGLARSGLAGLAAALLAGAFLWLGRRGKEEAPPASA